MRESSFGSCCWNEILRRKRRGLGIVGLAENVLAEVSQRVWRDMLDYSELPTMSSGLHGK